MAKNREDQVASEEPRESQTDDGGSGGGDDDDAPDVRVVEKDGQSVVEGSGESRSERRRRQAEERRRADAAEKQQLRDTLSGMQRTIDLLAQQRAQGTQPVVQQPKDDDEVDPEWDKLTDRQVELSQLMQQAQTTEDRARIMKEWRKAEFKKQRLLIERTTKPEFERMRPQPQEPMEVTVLKTEFADVLRDPRARARAQAYANIATADASASGAFVHPAQIHRDAITRAAMELGLRQAPSAVPPDHQRGRFGGAPPSGGPGGSGPFQRPLTKRERAAHYRPRRSNL